MSTKQYTSCFDQRKCRKNVGKWSEGDKTVEKPCLPKTEGLPEEKIDIKREIIKQPDDKIEILKIDFDNTTEKINLLNESMCYVPVMVNDNPNEIMSLIDSGSNATTIDNQLVEISGYDKNDIIPWRFGK